MKIFSNIIKSNNLTGLNKKHNLIQLKQENNLNESKHYPISTKEWFNSVYYFDKNIIKNLPVLDYIVNNLVRMFFNMNFMADKGRKFRRRRNKHRYNSSNKVFIANPEIRHLNEKVIITIYTFNRNKNYLIKTTEKLYKKIFNNFSISKLYRNILELQNKNTTNENFFINKKVKYRYNRFLKREYKLKFLNRLKKTKKKHNNIRRFFLLKNYKSLYLTCLLKNGLISNKYLNKISKFKLNELLYNTKTLHVHSKAITMLKTFIYYNNSIIKFLQEKKIFHNKSLIKKYIFSFFKKDLLKVNIDIMKTKLWRELFYLKYNQMLFINKYKYSYLYLNNLKQVIRKIYNKKIEFNIINLKHMHLDSKIFSDYISLKLRERKNVALKMLSKAMFFSKVTYSRDFLFNIHNFYTIKKNNLNLLLIYKKLENFVEKNKLNVDILHMSFYNIFNLKYLYSYNTLNKEKKDKLIYKSVKFRKISGVRLEAKGRLTRRLTASRAVFKVRYKGTLRNIDSIKKIPSVKIIGHLRSNIDYTNINSKTRNGCFGLKGWISSK